MSLLTRFPVARGRYLAPAADFDGTNDWLARGADLTGISDGKEGTFSLWFNLSSDPAGNAVLMGGPSGEGLWIHYDPTSDVYRVTGENAAGTWILAMKTASTYTPSDDWLHLLFAWDLAAGTGQIYVNDAEDRAGAPTLTNDTLDYTRGNWAIGALSGGGAKIAGAFADMWFHTTYIDISKEANRRRFITEDLRPARLGALGEYPLGAQPLLYLANPFDRFEINRGTGGNFSVTGALSDPLDSPSFR